MRRPFLQSCFIVGVLASALAACSDHRTTSRDATPPPPSLDFLLSAGDSTFWITGTPSGLRTRGAPIVLASWGGRFYEIYVTDDDRSFEDAVFVGQRLYRRDIATNDSLMVFVDTAAPRAAARYAEANPSARPLAPDEEGAEDPPVATTAEVDVLDVYGPYLSFEYHIDVHDPNSDAWHSTRRGVLDLRNGKTVTLRELFGATEGQRLSEAGRAAFLATLDSVRASVGKGESARRAAAALPAFRFDPSSFSVSDVDGHPTVDFAAPGSGSGGAGFTLPLVPIDARADSGLATAWWDGVRATLPVFAANGADLVWRPPSSSAGTPAYRVIARGDTARDDTSEDEVASVVIATNAHEWPAAHVTGPVRSIFWLESPPVDATQRRALQRAFEEAAMYDERTRSTSGPPNDAPGVLRFASRTPRTPTVAKRIPSSARHAAARLRHTR